MSNLYFKNGEWFLKFGGFSQNSYSPFIPHIAHRLSLIEPGPVHTEFEAKMIEDVKKKEYPGTDPDTLHYFKNVYLPSSVDIFETLGQRPDDVARVS